jgi:ABC-type lipoprotein export system ATPase subunit
VKSIALDSLAGATGNLDSQTSETIIELLASSRRAHRPDVRVVCHSAEET